MIVNFDSIMSWVIPIGGWVNLSGVGGPLKFQGWGEWKKESLQRMASLPKQGSTSCEHRDQINLVSSAGYLVFWMGGSHRRWSHLKVRLYDSFPLFLLYLRRKLRSILFFSVTVLLVCTWRHGGHVGGQTKAFFLFWVSCKSSRKKYVVLTPQSATWLQTTNIVRGVNNRAIYTRKNKTRTFRINGTFGLK